MLSPKIQSLFKTYISLDTARQDGLYYKEACTLLSSFLSENNFKTKIIPIPKSVAGRDNRVNVVAERTTNNDLPTLLIYNHIDVVPAQYKDAFVFKMTKDKVFGRGACDHKGSTVAILSALEALKDSDLRFNIIFIGTTDEETDQIEQLRYLGKKLTLPKNTMMFDPDTYAGGISVASLGLAQLEIRVKGKAAHSGSSHMGINAVEQAATLIEYLKLFEKTRLEAQTSRFASFPSTGVTHICSRCNVNMITGGIAPNVIPEICTLKVDFRFIPESDVAEETAGIITRLQAFAQKQHIEIEINVTASCESYYSEPPEAKRLNQIYDTITGEGGLYGVLGSTHAAQWCKELAIPHFGLGVARGDTNMHGVNEFAYLKDIEDLSKTLTLFLQ
jgi:acetylornithine deacetylase/succinyl-diaminopimelate desuccinylase-like protein